MPEFSDLPPLVQVIVSMLVVAVGGGLAIFGWTKKALAMFSVSPAQAAKATDAVVVSATFADGSAIRELVSATHANTEATTNLNRHLRESTEEQSRTTHAVQRLADRVDRVADLLSDQRDSRA